MFVYRVGFVGLTIGFWGSLLFRSSFRVCRVYYPVLGCTFF